MLVALVALMVVVVLFCLNSGQPSLIKVINVKKAHERFCLEFQSVKKIHCIRFLISRVHQ